MAGMNSSPSPFLTSIQLTENLLRDGRCVSNVSLTGLNGSSIGTPSFPPSLMDLNSFNLILAIRDLVL